MDFETRADEITTFQMISLFRIHICVPKDFDGNIFRAAYGSSRPLLVLGCKATIQIR